MASREQAVSNVPIDLVPTLSLVTGMDYFITTSGRLPVTIGLGTPNPGKGHPIYPKSRRCTDSFSVTIKSGEGVWVWASGPSAIVISEAE